jgi:predicted transcriptional regulator
MNKNINQQPFEKIFCIFWYIPVNMNKIKLKEKLIKEIQNLEDENILNEVYRLLEIESEELDVYKLNEEQISAVNEAREQISKGQFLTHGQAKKKIDEWLNK